MSLFLCLLMLASCGKKDTPAQSGEEKPDSNIPAGSSVSDNAVVSNDEDILAYRDSYIPPVGDTGRFLPDTLSRQTSVESRELAMDHPSLERSWVLER